ncbi:STAS domain-containing protein [Jatrophihabitans fulvus]
MTADIQLENRTGRPWVVLSGDIDLGVLTMVFSALNAHTQSGDVTVDLSAVASMDASSLAILFMSFRSAHTVRLVNVPPAVADMLELTDTSTLISVDHSLATP